MNDVYDWEEKEKKIANAMRNDPDAQMRNMEKLRNFMGRQNPAPQKKDELYWVKVCAWKPIDTGSLN